MGNLFHDAQAAALRTAIAWLDKNPAENLLKLIHLIEKLDHNGIWTKQLAVLKKELGERKGALYDLIMRMFTEIDPKVRSRLAENFVLNVMLAGSKKQDEILRKYDRKVPWGIFFKAEAPLLYNKLSARVKESMKEGIALFLFPEEDTSDPQDILKLGEDYPDAVIMFVIRAEEVNERLIRRLLHVHNCLPILSGEDESVEAAIRQMRKDKCAFAYCLREEAKLKEEEFLKYWMERGVINIFVCPRESISREESRAYHQLLDNIRDTNPIMSLELWNIAEDGSYSIAIGLGRDAETCMAIPM